MTFVYSNWYIVMAILVVAIVALVVTFVLMDKKDAVLLKEFVDSMQPAKEEVKEEPAKEEVATEQVKE